MYASAYDSFIFLVSNTINIDWLWLLLVGMLKHEGQRTRKVRDVDVTCLFIKETGQDVYDYVL